MPTTRTSTCGGRTGSASARRTRTGIWHETFLVRAGEYEAVYGNMPTYGLAKASRAVRVADAVGARERLKATVR